MKSSRRVGVRRGGSAVVVALLIGSLSVGSAGAAPELLATLNITAGNSNAVRTNFDLVQGQAYKLVLTGTATYSRSSGGASETIYMDAVYFFGSTRDPSNSCGQGCEGTYMEHAIGANPPDESFKTNLPGRRADDGSLKDPPPPPFDGQTHRYEWTFTAPASGRLWFRDAEIEGDSAMGSYKIEIYGEPGTTPTQCKQTISPNAQAPSPSPSPNPDCPPKPEPVTASEPAPGKSKAIAGIGPLAPLGGEAKVSGRNSSGDNNKNTFLAEADISEQVKEIKRRAGDQLVACIFWGPDAIDIDIEEKVVSAAITVGDRFSQMSIKTFLQLPRVQEKFKGLEGYDKTLIFCRELVIFLLAELSRQGPPTPGRTPLNSHNNDDFEQTQLAASAAAEQSGCHVERLVLGVQGRFGKITKVGLAGRQGRPASAPRYSCTSPAPGEMELTVRQGNESLRDSFGKNLDLAVARHPDAVQRDATLTFGLESASGEPGPSPSPNPSPSTTPSPSPNPSPSPSTSPTPTTTPTPTPSPTPSPSPSSSPIPGGVLEAEYSFQNNLDGACGAPALSALGTGTSFATETVDGSSRPVFTWPAGAGLQLNPFSQVTAPGEYTIVMLFRLQVTNDYRRILDFKNATTENGLYNFSGYIYFYGTSAGDTSVTPIKPNTYVQVVASRSSSGIFKGYVNGTKYMEFNDSAGGHGAVTNDTLRFFRDNGTGTSEDSPGAVARIRIYRTALTDAQVAGLDRVGSGPPAC